MKRKKIIIQASQWIGNSLTYNRAEQRGIVVLCIILLAVMVARAFIPSETFRKTPDFMAYSAEIAAFEAEWKKAADSDSMARVNRFKNYRSRYGAWRHDTGAPRLSAPRPLLLLDLNAADTFELQQLRGIGPAYARWIVNYRNRLRGFHDTRQVMEVFGIDSARYAEIAPNLKVTRDSIHPMDINKVTFKELLHHPYFPFPVTKNIMIYRQKHKMFKSVDELRNVEGITDSLFRRMVVYLRVGP